MSGNKRAAENPKCPDCKSPRLTLESIPVGARNPELAELIQKISDHFRSEGYQILGDNVRCELVLPSNYGGAFRTHYWERFMTVRRAITAFCDQNDLVSCNVLARTRNFSHAIKYFSSGQCLSICAPKPFPRLFSFRNGLLLLGSLLPGYCPDTALSADGRGRFFSVDPASDFSVASVPRSAHAIHYFDHDFPAHLAKWVNEDDPFTEEDGPWMASNELVPDVTARFPTPLFDSIFEHQGYSFSTLDPPPSMGSLFYVYAMLGRLLYAVNEKDTWNVAICLLGCGLGKTVVLEVIRSLFQDGSVGVLSSTDDRYSLAPLVDCQLVVVPEFQYIPLSCHEFRSMVRGNSITANVLRRDPVIVHSWKSPLLMAGNALPEWESPAPLLQNVFYVPMNVNVAPGDINTRLLQQIKEQELVHILLKIHTCYHTMRDHYRFKPFWEVVPLVFREARDHADPTKRFLLTANTIERDSPQELMTEHFARYISLGRFVELRDNWCRCREIPVLKSQGLHTQAALESSGHKIVAMRLPGADKDDARGAQLYVLGIGEVGNCLRLPVNP